MSSLHDRLLSICLFYNKLDKIASLQEFVSKLEEKVHNNTLTITDDQVIERILKDLASKATTKNNNNNNQRDDDDDVEDEDDTILFREPPLEVRQDLIRKFQQEQQQERSTPEETSIAAFTRELALEKFGLKTLQFVDAVAGDQESKPGFVLVDSSTFTTSSAPSIDFDVSQDPRFLKSIKQQHQASSTSTSPPTTFAVQVFVGEWDESGVFLYQAFNDAIADYALQHQTFKDCPEFSPTRMTWAKPSFAWMLYRSSYGKKPNQNRVLKIKISHRSLASLLSQCQFVDTNKNTKATTSNAADDSSASATLGRVQWDPERDLFAPDAALKVPREMLRRRAIQIGLQGKLSAQYVESILSIEDCTEIARRVGDIHQSKSNPFKTQKQKEDGIMALMKGEFRDSFPKERPYFPALCSNSVLTALGMLPGTIANAVSGLGRGKAA